MTKCPAMHSFPGLKISVGCMISLALLPLGGGHHAESISSPCCLLTVAKFGKCLSCMHWDNSSSAPAAQCAGVSSTFLEVGAAAHQALGCITWGKKIQELFGQPWQRHNLTLKKVQISANLKEVPLLAECAIALGTICP